MQLSHINLFLRRKSQSLLSCLLSVASLFFPSFEVGIFDIEVRRAFFAQRPIGCNTPNPPRVSNYLVALHYSSKTTNSGGFDGFVPVV